MIYIREAHPSDGWQVDANVEEGIEILQPQEMEERLSVAQDFIDDTGLSIPVLVDGIDNGYVPSIIIKHEQPSIIVPIIEKEKRKLVLSVTSYIPPGTICHYKIKVLT